MTPLHCAAIEDRTAVVKALIAAGADLEAVTVRCSAMFFIAPAPAAHSVVVLRRRKMGVHVHGMCSSDCRAAVMLMSNFLRGRTLADPLLTSPRTPQSRPSLLPLWCVPCLALPC